MLEQYWTEEEVGQLAAAKEYKDLTPIAFTIIDRMPQPVGQVCGPLTTGGEGMLTANNGIFHRAIVMLRNEGKNIFNQLPFESTMQRLRKIHDPGRYAMNLLTDFYLPLFESGKLQTLYFLPKWETSTGSRWEREHGERLGLEIVELEKQAELHPDVAIEPNGEAAPEFATGL